MVQRILVTGGPGAGKTSILNVLANEGVRIAADVPREIIKERLAAGLDPRPSPRDFAMEIFRRSVLAYDEAAQHGLTVFERGVCDSIAGLLSQSEISRAEADELMSRYRYDEPVFVPPPWPEIYTTDAERDHTFEHAVRVYEGTMRWYRQFGYRVSEIPRGSVVERAEFLLREIQRAAQ